MGKGFVAVEQGHVVLVLQPQGTTTTAALSGACFDMSSWGHATILVAGGKGTAVTAVTVKECTAATGSGATAITYRYAKEDTAAGDTLDAALAWASTLSLSAGSTGVYAVIEVDADELADGYNWVRVDFSANTAGAPKDLACFAVLSGGRYQEDITATVLS